MKRLAFLVLAACSGGGSSKTQQGSVVAPAPNALAAFETVRSVLQHPRCQNCHPAGDAPLQGDDGRVHNQNILRGPEGKGMVGANCTTCHQAANPPAELGANIPPGSPDWHMPPPQTKMVFVGVSPKDLCEAIKDPARNGGKDAAALRKHLEDPLVTWAWSPGVGRSKPPVSYEAFVAAWHQWDGAGMPCPDR
jgi:hypothetical protein